jgi:predicted RNase H-like nuclease
VYPHPALLSLTRSGYRLPYKVSKSKTYWPDAPVAERIERLLRQHRAILSALAREMGEIPLPIPQPHAVHSLAQLKRYEDALDALICGWVGTRYLAGRILAYGDGEAAIWVP